MFHLFSSILFRVKKRGKRRKADVLNLQSSYMNNMKGCQQQVHKAAFPPRYFYRARQMAAQAASTVKYHQVH